MSLIVSMHNFFSNFCVFQTDNTKSDTYIYSNELDARNKLMELNIIDSAKLDSLFDDYKTHKINFKEYNDEFDKIINTNKHIVRVCKFMSPEKQNSICMKKGYAFYQ